MAIPLQLSMEAQNLLALLLCAGLPGLLFILGGIRHWRKQEITFITPDPSRFHWRRPITEYGKNARSNAIFEILFGLFILCIGSFIYESTQIVKLADQLNKLIFDTHHSTKIALVLFCGDFPGLMLLVLGFWMQQTGKAFRFKNILSWRFGREPEFLTGKTANIVSSRCILLGCLILLLSSLFLFI